LCCSTTFSSLSLEWSWKPDLCFGRFVIKKIDSYLPDKRLCLPQNLSGEAKQRHSYITIRNPTGSSDRPSRSLVTDLTELNIYPKVQCKYYRCRYRKINSQFRLEILTQGAQTSSDFSYFTGSYSKELWDVRPWQYKRSISWMYVTLHFRAIKAKYTFNKWMGCL